MKNDSSEPTATLQCSLCPIFPSIVIFLLAFIGPSQNSVFFKIIMRQGSYAASFCKKVLSRCKDMENSIASLGVWNPVKFARLVPSTSRRQQRNEHRTF